MARFWRAALAVAGLGAVGAFVFWSLYNRWLSLKIFANLTPDQTFMVMLVFLILTFLALIAMLGTYALRTRSQPPPPNASSYSVPVGATFKDTVEKIATGKLVQFENFSQNELTAVLSAREFQAPDDFEALKQIRLLADGKVRPYSVEASMSGLIVLKVK